MLRVPHMGLFQSTFMSLKYLESQTYFIFCRTYCCILCRGNMPRKKSNKLGSCIWLHCNVYLLSEWRKGVFPSYIGYNFLGTTFCFSHVFEISEGSQSKERPRSMEKLGTVFSHWAQVNTSLIPTAGANDLPIASLRRLAHKQEDKSASTITRNTGGKSNQCWPNGQWQNKKGKNRILG